MSETENKTAAPVDDASDREVSTTPAKGEGVQEADHEGSSGEGATKDGPDVEVPDAGSLDQGEVVLDEEDEKIAKKKAKKGGMSEAEAKHLRFLQVASPKVQRLWLEFGLQMARLGHILEPVMNFTPQGITPSIKFRAMDLEQMEKTKDRVANSIKEMEEFYKGPKQTEPEAATEEVTPAAPDETVK